MNWTESVESCNADGQVLASIRSQPEHDKYVADMPKGKRKPLYLYNSCLASFIIIVYTIGFGENNIVLIFFALLIVLALGLRAVNLYL